MNHKLILLLLMMGLNSAVFSQSTADSLTKELTKLAQENTFVGFAAAIVNEEGVLYKKGFGFANEAKQIPYTTQTVQPLASISKTFIAASLMKLVEQKKLTLNDPINQYLPFEIKNPHFPNQAITIQHLVTHTSGIKDTKYYDYSYLFEDVNTKFHKNFSFGLRRILFKRYLKKAMKSKDMPMPQFLERIYSPTGEWYRKKNFLKEKPGAKVNYTNNGSALVALIIEKVSGMDYRDFVTEQVLQPLGMNHSGWMLKDYPEAERTQLYLGGNFPLPNYHLITYPDGGFVTDMEDYTKYFITMIKGYKGNSDFLTTESFKTMFTRPFENISEHGVFWDVGKKMIGHSGGDPGVITYTYFNRKTGHANLLFFNTSEVKKEGEQIGAIWKVLDKYGKRL